MGSYLSKPVTEKESIDEFKNNISFGASSMQGWRITQEDAHNTILNFDEDQSLFAVYDGHGGDEVAVYTALHFPDHLRKNLKEIKDCDEALSKTFLEFDSKLVQKDTLKILQNMAKNATDSDSEHFEEEELETLKAEAVMPIDSILRKYSDIYSQSKKGPTDNVDAKPVEQTTTQASSSGLSAVNSNQENSSSLKDSTEMGSNSKDVTFENASSSPEANNTDVKLADNIPNGDSHNSNGSEIPASTATSNPKENIVVNGDHDEERTKGPGKGKGHSKGKNVLSAQEVEALKRVRKDHLRKPSAPSSLLYKMVKEDDLSDDSEDDTDTDEEDHEDSDTNIGEDEEDSDSDCEEEEIEEEEEEEDYDEKESKIADYLKDIVEEPCFDSGCTACVALLNKRTLYVANVGDSRCVVYRKNKAIDMSVDHKPEDDVEADRILKAGGVITDDGRVNGGLNLSRALGDHRYKQNKDIPAIEQMISPEPDIQTLELTDADTFMVIACDGIWNSMTSDEVCEFVDEQIKLNCKTSAICEMLFDECLAPDTTGDGTGCDNMTCIIVRFDFANKSKRKPEESSDELIESEGPDTKKHKLES